MAGPGLEELQELGVLAAFATAKQVLSAVRGWRRVSFLFFVDRSAVSERSMARPTQGSTRYGATLLCDAQGRAALWCGVCAVSYTHLDVYKRQILS